MAAEAAFKEEIKMGAEAAFKIDFTPECKEVETQALTIPEQAMAVKVNDVETYKEAGALWKSIKDLRKKVAETFDPLIKNAHQLHKSILSKKQAVDKPLEAAEKTVKGAMEAYDREQERLRREEEERLRELARKEEEERRLKEAIALEKAGQKEIANAVMEAPVTVAPVVLPKVTPKIQGGPIYRTTWKFRITNPNLIPKEYLVPDQVKIGGVVRALKGATNIPGIEVFESRV